MISSHFWLNFKSKSKYRMCIRNNFPFIPNNSQTFLLIPVETWILQKHYTLPICRFLTNCSKNKVLNVIRDNETNKFRYKYAYKYKIIYSTWNGRVEINVTCFFFFLNKYHVSSDRNSKRCNVFTYSEKNYIYMVPGKDERCQTHTHTHIHSYKNLYTIWIHSFSHSSTR